MDPDADLIASSTSISSISSSDLDTESTGSFFPDRSTSLGALMGVSFANITAARPARVASRMCQPHDIGNTPAAPPTLERRRRGHRRGRSWWRLCRDEVGPPTSLGEFLQVERRLSIAGEDHLFFGDAEHEAVGAGQLFADGRVLPPPPPRGRLPVLIAGICSGG